MTFHKGQLVALIEDHEDARKYYGLKKGAVLRVAGIFTVGPYTALLFEEIDPRPGTVGFNSVHFRPVSKQSTELFNSLLVTPPGLKVDA